MRHPDELNDDHYYDYLIEEAEEGLFQEQVADRIEEVYDANFEAIFRSKVSNWASERWRPAELTAYRVGKEARGFSERELHAPAVVWASTCVEIIFRDLTLKPIFTGLFLGGAWADEALEAMLRNRWVRHDTRAIAKNVLLFVARVDVETLQAGAVRPWNDIPVFAAQTQPHRPPGAMRRLQTKRIGRWTRPRHSMGLCCPRCGTSAD